MIIKSRNWFNLSEGIGKSKFNARKFSKIGNHPFETYVSLITALDFPISPALRSMFWRA